MSDSKYPTVKLCRDCLHSEPEPRSTWNLRCKHPMVNARDPWALSTGGDAVGSSAKDERTKSCFFAECGMKGKLWEPKK